MPFTRRGLFASAPAVLAVAVVGAGSAFADDSTTDLAVSCDSAALPAVSSAGRAYRAKTGVRVRLFPTAPGLLLPQLEREIQNDVIVTRTTVIDQAEKAGLVATGGRSAGWRNRLVTASAKAPSGAEGSFVVPDATPGSDIDGRAILHQMGVTPGSVIGVIDTGAVAWTLVNGGARQGLLHQTEVAADSRLQAVSPVPDAAWPPIIYAATVTKLARRGDPAAFVAFLGSADGQAALRFAGLEPLS